MTDGVPYRRGETYDKIVAGKTWAPQRTLQGGWCVTGCVEDYLNQKYGGLMHHNVVAIVLCVLNNVQLQRAVIRSGCTTICFARPTAAAKKEQQHHVKK